MPCPLSARIALVPAPVLAVCDEAAVRINNHRDHTVILYDDAAPPHDRMKAIQSLYAHDERHLLVENAVCTCDRTLALLTG